METRQKPLPDDRRLLASARMRARLLRSAEQEGAPLQAEDGLRPLMRGGRAPWHLDAMADDGVTK